MQSDLFTTRETDYNLPEVRHVSVGEVKLAYRPDFTKFAAPKLAGPADMYEYLLGVFDAETICLNEQFVALYLDFGLRLLGHSIISVGGTTGTVADPKLIFQRAILLNCSVLVVAHNHPSGRLEPSKSDISLTAKLKTGAKLFEMELADHLIVSRDGYLSFAQERML